MKLKQLLTKTLLVAVCLLGGASSAWANQTSLITNVTLPDVPASSLDLSSQTTYTPDGNGWIVFDPLAATSSSTPAWWKHITRATLATSCGDGGYVKGTSVSVAPFNSWTNGTNGFKTTGSASTALRFTGAEKVSFLLNPRSKSDGKKQCVSIYSYNVSTTTQSLIETKTTTVNNNAWEELCFTDLSPENVYVAYVYKEYKSGTDQNGAIMEIAIKAPVATPPGAISFSPAAGSVAAGSSVTLTSSGATTIVYQWGASAVDGEGDWSTVETYSDSNKPVVPAAGSTNTVLSVKATNANGSTYGSASYTPVKMAMKTIYSFADGIGSQTVTAGTASVESSPMSLGNTAGRIKLTPATGFKFKNGDAIEFSGSIGNTAKAYGIKYGPTTSLGIEDLFVAAGQPCHVSGTLSLASDADNLFIGRYDGTTTNFNTFTVRRLTAATSEAFTGTVKINGSAATEDVDYTKDGNVFTLIDDYSAMPTVCLESHIVFADESTEDQNVLVAFGAPDGEYFTGTAEIDGTTYTVKAPCGQINALKVVYKESDTTVKEENLDVTDLKVGATYSAPYRMYVMKDGKLYNAAKQGSGEYYKKSITLEFNTTVTINVTAQDIPGEIVFFEDFDGESGENAFQRASNGLANNNTEFTSEDDLPAGVYNFIVKAQNKGRSSSVKIGETTVFSISDVNASTNTWTDKTISDVNVPTAGKLAFVKGGANSIDCYDIIIAIKQNVSVSTVSGRNYGSFVSTKKLDFSAVDGISAYIATGFNGAKDAIVLQEVDIVPAGTPIIVKTDTKGDTKNVPVTTDDASDVSGNALVAGDGTTAWNGTDGYTYFYLASDLFHKATSGTLQSGKAYLKVADGDVPSAREFTFTFSNDEEVTGIENLTPALSEGEEAVYDLQGRRVAQPTKGLYIVNGKKVIVK